ncbi:DUF427 domain-containing protein [Paraburkholderia panacisoli]|uniref:DUF427 domain-containing protein n=1 Tax=Paraburkholderia panacisoli TaxID=2603818 RepID=A0A5B0G3X5_9BURK|nr:DUF427 domain-containing protein [Paraburkholderia panacisoli]KAA0998144.1 DUF427 domain-containing protein [Paraburkholderia panacisoli]
MLKPGLAIVVKPNLSRVVVWVGGRPVADTRRALTVRIGTGSAADYVPFEDVQMSLLKRRQFDARQMGAGHKVYFDILFGSTRIESAAWTFDEQLEGTDVVREYVAFDASKVDAIEQQPRHGMLQPW